jgi:hypothetical protein
MKLEIEQDGSVHTYTVHCWHSPYLEAAGGVQLPRRTVVMVHTGTCFQRLPVKPPEENPGATGWMPRFCHTPGAAGGIGIAVCGGRTLRDVARGKKRDQFSRDEGRKLAFGRAILGAEWPKGVREALWKRYREWWGDK